MSRSRHEGIHMLVIFSFFCFFCLVHGEMSLLDEETFATLSEVEIQQMKEREVENCVPFNIRSFVLGHQAIVEWDTRRTYIRKIHEKMALRREENDQPSPWQSCRDVMHVQVRYRTLGSRNFSIEQAITYNPHGADRTTHKAWISLPFPLSSQSYEYVVGSTFHGWSQIHLLGHNVVLPDGVATACHPKHIHTAYGRVAGSFHVQWMTNGECTNTNNQVLLIEGYLVSPIETSPRTPRVIQANSSLFIDDGKKQIHRWMHVAEILDLQTNTNYSYIVGNPDYNSWSILCTTRTAPSFDETREVLPQRFIVTGDIGYQNAATLPMIQSEVAEGVVDAIIAMGDYAYDLHLANGRVGDIFMEEIEPIASRIPFMVAPGNHEAHNRFSHYTERFRLMPSNTGHVQSGAGPQLAPNNWFYSIDVGLVHFAFISTEIFHMKPLEPALIQRQLQWLEQDLASANANRRHTPWLIVVGHRPLYCTSDEKNCVVDAAKLRALIEDLFYEYGVDLYICGHQHNYERAFDVYRSKTWKRTKNMRATTHILTGASGQYLLSVMRKSFELPAEPWDAFRNSIFGYSRLQIYNETHLHWQQVESDPENPAAHGLYGAVVDDVWLIQEQHGSFKHRHGENGES